MNASSNSLNIIKHLVANKKLPVILYNKNSSKITIKFSMFLVWNSVCVDFSDRDFLTT